MISQACLKEHFEMKKFQKKYTISVSNGSDFVEDYDTNGSNNIFIVAIFSNKSRYHIFQIETDNIFEASEIKSDSEFYLKHFLSGRYLALNEDKQKSKYFVTLTEQKENGGKFGFKVVENSLKDSSEFLNRIYLYSHQETKICIKVNY